MEDLAGHLHRIRLVRLSNGSRIVLKVGPPPSTPLLSHENRCLATEAAVYALLAKSNLPIPHILKHDPRSLHLGSPFLLTTCLPGISYESTRPYLTRSERAGIEHQLTSLQRLINQHTSSAFGSVVAVSSGQGQRTWRDAFKSMFAAVFMDAEDMLVNLPFTEIAEQLSRHEDCLDKVIEPRLVIPGFGEPGNVLIDRKTNEVTGLLDFGRAFWGDPAMALMENRNEAKELL